MRLSLFMLILPFSLMNFGQESPSFFVKIPDSNYIFIQTHDLFGNRVATFNSPNKGLNSLVSQYEVYNVEHVFKNSNRVKLQNMYLVRCNDIKLMDDIKNSFSNYYMDAFDAAVEMLAIPNDFGMTGGFLEYQEELNYIRAPEAWDITTGSSDVIIGISDNYVQPAHEDLAGKVNVVYGTNCAGCTAGNAQHGSQVSSMAAANTNNGLGMAAIGYDSSIYNAVNSWIPGVDALSQMSGVKVINTAWVSNSSPTLQEMFNEVVEDRDVVVVGSAGNWNSTNLIYPAAFKNVISVSSIAHETRAWTDVWGNYYNTVIDNHVIQFNSDLENSHQHNDSVDIVAPGYGVLVARPQTSLTFYNRSGGTSFASPIVSGTIALMFDQNYCIDPKEVETILKLTAVKIDDLPANLPFYGQLGAGKLDAYEAVKMSKDMADEFGTVEVKDRILYRPWFYKLVTAPYEIKMSNNNVSQGSKLKFRARNNIEILSGEYFPGIGGYVDLQIDSNLDLNHCPPRPGQTSQRQALFNVKDSIDLNYIEVYPTLVLDNLIVKNHSKSIEDKIESVEIYDFIGVKVFEVNNIKTNESIFNLIGFKSGIYFVKILDASKNVIHTEKIIKK